MTIVRNTNEQSYMLAERDNENKNTILKRNDETAIG